jgi:hypothetical protein
MNWSGRGIRVGRRDVRGGVGLLGGVWLGLLGWVGLGLIGWVRLRLVGRIRLGLLGWVWFGLLGRVGLGVLRVGRRSNVASRSARRGVGGILVGRVWLLGVATTTVARGRNSDGGKSNSDERAHLVEYYDIDWSICWKGSFVGSGGELLMIVVVSCLATNGRPKVKRLELDIGLSEVRKKDSERVGILM